MNKAETILEAEDPLLTKLKSDVDALVDNLQKTIETSTSYLLTTLFSKAQSQVGAASSAVNPNLPPRTKNLPWFKYGLRGFLNKLWHGDHPNNPMWQQAETVNGRLTLESYALLEDRVQWASDIVIDEILEEAEIDKDILQKNLSSLSDIFINFKNNLFKLILNALQEKVKTNSPQPQVASTPTKAPEDSLIQKSKKWWARQTDVSAEQRKNIQDLVDSNGNIVDEIYGTRKAVEFARSRYRNKSQPSTQLNPSNLDDIQLIWPTLKRPLISAAVQEKTPAVAGQEEIEDLLLKNLT